MCNYARVIIAWSKIARAKVSLCFFIVNKELNSLISMFSSSCYMHGRACRRKALLISSYLGALLVCNFKREIHFSNTLLKRSHQEMSWKLAGATNFYLQRNVIFSKVANLLLHSYISKTFQFLETPPFGCFRKYKTGWNVLFSTSMQKIFSFVILKYLSVIS